MLHSQHIYHAFASCKGLICHLGLCSQVGVLTRHILDDGRGFARSKVFKHGHEEGNGQNFFHWPTQLMCKHLAPFMLAAPLEKNVLNSQVHVASTCAQVTASLLHTNVHLKRANALCIGTTQFACHCCAVTFVQALDCQACIVMCVVMHMHHNMYDTECLTIAAVATWLFLMTAPAQNAQHCLVN